MRQHNDGQRLMLMSYPNLFENYGQCVIGIGLEEAPWLNHMGNLLVQHMGEVVARANTEAGRVFRTMGL